MAIASLSLHGDPVAFADALGEAFAHHGFAIIADHGIDPGLIARAEAEMRAVFALSEAVKRRYHIPGSGGARGYTPFRIEIAKDASDYDLKEFWHVGRELPPGHPYDEVMQPNVWPEELPGFRDVMLHLFTAFDGVGGRLLDAIGRHLSLTPHCLSDATRDGNSVLRLLHYPPVPAGAPGIRAGAHEDINAITLLLGAEEAGLEIRDREGDWLPVAPRAGELVVNVGDMLQRLTNGRLRSTTHRVRNPAPERRGVSRWSMPFFLHFRPDFLIETLPGCIGPDGDHPAPITANDYLLERLREIRLL